MAEIIYGMCALSALLCATLLLLAYRRSRYRLLLWSGLCFAGLTISNLLLIADKVIYPEVDMAATRSVVASVALAMLIFGLIWDDK